jgi:hypothetical protein
MFRLSLAVLLLTSGCGGSNNGPNNVCERIHAANDAFFSGPCQRGCGSTTRGEPLYCPAEKADISTTDCRAKLWKCTADDLKLLEAYAACFEGLPTCEKGGYSIRRTCPFPTILDLSVECTFKVADFERY